MIKPSPANRARQPRLSPVPPCLSPPRPAGDVKASNGADSWPYGASVRKIWPCVSTTMPGTGTDQSMPSLFATGA